jgi:hypothetical protein
MRVLCRAINIENNKPNAVVNLLTGEEGAVPATARCELRGYKTQIKTLIKTLKP